MTSFLVHACRPEERKICISVVVLGVIIGSVLFAYAAFEKTGKQDKSLRQVFVVFRHGDRTPTETYPKDPYLNYSWPGGWGTLTKTGMRQMYNLGNWIREEYGWLANNEYHSSSTVVNSSYSDRCIESTQSLLAGLYRPSQGDYFLDDLPWRPIAVHYVPRNQDKILVVKAPCPKLDRALQEAYKNESSSHDRSEYFQRLEESTGAPMKTITDVEFLYNTLEIEKINNLELPSWLENYFNEEMRAIAARSYSLFTSNTLQRRLRGGPLLKDILFHMENVEKSQKKLFLYGTHDINLVNTLRAMGFLQDFKLNLGATLIFELRNAAVLPNSQEVRVFMLNNTDSKTPYRLDIPDCENPCLLNDLYKVWKDVLPQNWDQECQE